MPQKTNPQRQQQQQQRLHRQRTSISRTSTYQQQTREPDEEETTLKNVLAESEQEYRLQQALLESQEAKELERVRLESRATLEIERLRIASLEKIDQETLQSVLEKSKQETSTDHHQLLLTIRDDSSQQPPQPSTSNNPIFDQPQEIRERLELELAIKLSLQSSSSSSSSTTTTNQTLQTQSTSFSHPHPIIVNQSADNDRTIHHIQTPIEPPPSYEHSIVEEPVAINCANNNNNNNLLSISIPVLTASSSSSSSSLPSSASTLPSLPPSSTLPTTSSSSASSLIVSPSSHESPSSFCNNPISSPILSIPIDDLSLQLRPQPSPRSQSGFGRPLPPVPLPASTADDPIHPSLTVHSPPQAHYPPSCLSPVEHPTVHSPSLSPIRLPSPCILTPGSSSLYSREINQEDPFSDEFALPDQHQHSSNESLASINFSEQHHQKTNPLSNNPLLNRQSSTFTIDSYDGSNHVSSSWNTPSESYQRPAVPAAILPFTSPSSASSSSIHLPSSAPDNQSLQTDCMLNESFEVNPSPPQSVIEGVKYGVVKSIFDHPDCKGQFPDTLVLTQYPHAGQEKVSNPMIAIEAWSWNRLLTYLMWHGNSSIEPGPLDITESEDEQLGSWQAALSVIFTERGQETSVRLVLELVAGNGDSMWSRAEATRRRRHSSSIASSVRLSSDSAVQVLGPQVIHLPKPFSKLPIQVAALAILLHEIHTASRMVSCSSSSSLSLANTFRSSSSSSNRLSGSGGGHETVNNTEILVRLSKAIKNNAKVLGEEQTVFQEEEKLMKRGKKWLKKKKKEISGNTHNPQKDSSLSDRQSSDVTKIEGLGLPLPNGANLVKPWKADWE